MLLPSEQQVNLFSLPVHTGSSKPREKPRALTALHPPGYAPFFSISVAAPLKSAGFTESRPRYLFGRVR